jgi:hypothetical protein
VNGTTLATREKFISEVPIVKRKDGRKLPSLDVWSARLPSAWVL